MKLKLYLLTFILTNISCQEKHKDFYNQNTNNEKYQTEMVVKDLSIPWGMTWLPDDSMLITEKKGEIIHYKNGEHIKLKNVPSSYQNGQGGFLDIETHPNYSENGWIYMTLSSSKGTGNGGNTQLIRFQIENDSLIHIEELYKAEPNSTKGQHFGSRITFDNDGFLYFSIGDRGDRNTNPQDVTRDGGKIYRLHDDGSIPSDNPFVGQNNAKAAIFTYGHRNPQGLTTHPITGEIWSHEHGPKGGDEINILKKGANYGWPVVTYGVNYSGTIISNETVGEGIEDPVHYWDPSIAPCGMAFVTGDKFPEIKGDLLIGSLKFSFIEVLKLGDDNKVITRKKLVDDIGRVRNVKLGPDGFIYAAIEGKGIIKLMPLQ